MSRYTKEDARSDRRADEIIQGYANDIFGGAEYKVHMPGSGLDAMIRAAEEKRDNLARNKQIIKEAQKRAEQAQAKQPKTQKKDGIGR